MIRSTTTRTRNTLRWGAIFAGFAVTAGLALLVVPLLERAGLNLSAGPVDAGRMVAILAGGLVAGRLAGRLEGMHGAIVAVLYIAIIVLGGTTLAEIGVARQFGLGALGKVDSWDNYGRDFFHFVAGSLGGLLATPLNDRDRARENALLRSDATTRRRPAGAASGAIASSDDSAPGDAIDQPAGFGSVSVSNTRKD